jgi:hypothetical protein
MQSTHLEELVAGLLDDGAAVGGALQACVDALPLREERAALVLEARRHRYQLLALLLRQPKACLRTPSTTQHTKPLLPFETPVLCHCRQVLHLIPACRLRMCPAQKDRLLGVPEQPTLCHART